MNLDRLRAEIATLPPEARTADGRADDVIAGTTRTTRTSQDDENAAISKLGATQAMPLMSGEAWPSTSYKANLRHKDPARARESSAGA